MSTETTHTHDTLDPNPDETRQADAPSPFLEGGDGGGPPRAGWLRRLLRVVLGFLTILVLAVVALLAGVVLLLAFFPGNFALNQVRTRVPLIEENGIEIGNFSFSILSGLELDNIRIAPPKGYTQPILTIRKIRLAYSPFALASNEVVIDEILLDSPHVNLETLDGKTNIDAFLENLTKSAQESPETEPEPEPPAEASPPNPWRVVLNRFELNDFSVNLNDGERLVDFQRLDVRVRGHYSETESQFDGEIVIEGGEEGRGNLRLEQKDPVPVDAEILLALLLRFSASQVTNPKADVDLSLRVATQKVTTQWPLEPVDLNLSVKAHADLPEDQAEIERLTLTFNQSELINLSGKLAGLMEQRDVALVLHRLHLPLDRFAPFAKAFVEGVDFGGDVAIDDLRVTGHVPDLLNNGLPTATGKVHIENVWAKLPAESLEVSGFNVDLTLDTRPEATAPDLDPAAIQAKGLIRLDLFRHPQATVRELSLSLDARADGIDPKHALAGLALQVGSLSLNDPALGSTTLSLGLDLRALANLADNIFAVESLNLNVSDILKLDLQAKVALDPETGGLVDHTARLFLHPVNLPKLLALAPPGVRKDIPKMTLAGSVGLEVNTRGAVPMPLNDPMTLPVHLAVALSLNDISVTLTDPDMALVVDSLHGALSLEGSPADLALDARLGLARFLKPDQGLTVTTLSVPIQGRVTPRKTDLTLSLEAETLRHEQEAATLNGVKLDLVVSATGKLLEQKIDAVTADLSLTLRDILYAKELTTRLSDQRTHVSLRYDAALHTATVGLSLGLSRLEVPEQQTTITDFALAVNVIAHDIDPFATPTPRLYPPLAELSVDMTVGRVEKPDALPTPLTGNSLVLRGRMHDMRDIDLAPFTFRVPTLGVVLDMTGKVWGILDRRMEPPDFKTRWPEFDAEVFAGLDTAERIHVAEGLDVEGKAGLNVRVRSLPDNFARVDGTLVAKDFSLWTESTGEVEREDGSIEPTRTNLELSRFNADVPMVQMLNLQQMSLVAASGNIFEEGSRGILYDTMRQYSKQQSNFQIDRVTWNHTEGEVSKTVSVDKLALDMIYRDNTFAIDRLYIDLLGGGITGALQVQLATLPPEPLDVRVHFENQITGVNLGYLAAEDPSRVTSETELSSLITMDFGLLDRYLEGRIDITRLSLKHLDTLLHFLDPGGKDPKVQKNRDLINAWYVDLVDPKIKLVSMWIQYGNLNMDIAMDAGIIGPILKRILESSRIRRLNIVPILNAFLPGKGDDTNRLVSSPEESALAAP